MGRGRPLEIPLTTKNQLREQVRARRLAIPPEERLRAEHDIAEQIRALPECATGRIAVYLSIQDELSTVTLVDRWLAEGRELGAPRMRNDRIEIAPFRSRDELVRGQLGIREPVAPLWEHFDVAIVPGLVFTAAGDRMGYGKGHYDTLLAAHPETFTVGICFRCQLVEAIPLEAHDVRLRKVLST